MYTKNVRPSKNEGRTFLQLDSCGSWLRNSVDLNEEVEELLAAVGLLD